MSETRQGDNRGTWSRNMSISHWTGGHGVGTSVLVIGQGDME